MAPLCLMGQFQTSCLKIKSPTSGSNLPLAPDTLNLVPPFSQPSLALSPGLPQTYALNSSTSVLNAPLPPVLIPGSLHPSGFYPSSRRWPGNHWCTISIQQLLALILQYFTYLLVLQFYYILFLLFNSLNRFVEA